MMKYAVAVLFLFLGLNTSQASTPLHHQNSIFQKHLVSKTPTATKNVLAHAVSRPQRKLLVAANLIDEDDDDDLPGPDELVLQSPYARFRIPEKKTVPDLDDDPVSDYVAIRLAVARARALARYRELWG